MGARIRFVSDVVPDGDAPEFRVVAGPREVALWERTGKGRSLGKLESDPSMTALYEIAYTACKRQGLVSCSLAEFLDGYDVHPVNEDEDADGDESGPTRTAP